MRNRFYVSDLDGTLLDRRGYLSGNTKKKLLDLLSRGLRFTVATARGIHSVRPLFQGIPLSFPIVELNGAMITDLASGKHFKINAVKQDLTSRILSLFSEAELPPLLVSTTGSEDFLHYFKPVQGKGERYLSDLVNESPDRLREVRHVDEVLRFQTASINCFESRERLEPVYLEILRRWPDELKTVFYDDYQDPSMAWLSVYDEKATKDHGIRTVLDMHDIHHDSVTVFGDQSNDLPMFQAFSHAVAVENAIPEIKQHADEVIGHHAEDSVALYLHEIFENHSD